MKKEVIVVNNRVVYLEDIIEKFINGPSHLDKDQIIYLINRIPSFDISADKPQGEWIYWRGEDGMKRCKCSRCLTSYGCLDTPYCPNCGTKMVGEKSKETNIDDNTIAEAVNDITKWRTWSHTYDNACMDGEEEDEE